MGLREDYQICKHVIKTHSASFYKAFSKLPRQKRRAVYAVYAFCRAADDTVDVHGDAGALTALQLQLEAFENGDTPDTPTFRALRDVFDHFQMSFEPFYQMIEGQKRDLAFKTPETEAELDDYCYYVAGTVGLMLLPIVASENHETLRDAAIDLGRAMQYTNILRDVGEDLDLGRRYLPDEWLQRYGVSEDLLKQKKVNGAFITLWRYAAHRAQSLYSAHQNLLHLYDPDSRPAMKRAILYYSEILNAVRANEYDCLTQRARVSNFKKFTLLIKSRQ